MGSSSSSSDHMTNTLRFADYIEYYHNPFLGTVWLRSQSLLDDSPYSGYTDVDVDSGFIGLGHTIADFPSLFDLYGTHMAGIDVDRIFHDTFGNFLTKDGVDDVVAVDSAEQEDIVESVMLPSYLSHMRNLNAVGSSTFVIGVARAEEVRVKKVVSTIADLHTALLGVYMNELLSYMNWKKSVVTTYALSMHSYYVKKSIIDDTNYYKHFQDEVWALYELDFMRAAIAAIKGLKSWEKDKGTRRRSQTSRFFLMAQGAATGASIGGQIGGAYGAIGGAVIGWQIGIAQAMLENGNPLWWIGWFDPLVGSYFAQQD